MTDQDIINLIDSRVQKMETEFSQGIDQLVNDLDTCLTEHLTNVVHSVDGKTGHVSLGSNYLPLSGGTMTGNLNVDGDVNVSGNVTLYAPVISQASGTVWPQNSSTAGQTNGPTAGPTTGPLPGNSIPPIHGGYPAVGTVVSGGSIGIGSVNTTVTPAAAGAMYPPAGYSNTMTVTSSIYVGDDELMEEDVPYSMDPELPPLVIDSMTEDGTRIDLVLTPDYSAPAMDLFKIMVAVASYADQSSFNFYLYVKKHNLERHFKFEEVL